MKCDTELYKDLSVNSNFGQSWRKVTNSLDDDHLLGRDIAQAVSRWLPTAAVRGSRPGRHVEFCGGQSGVGTGFFRVLRFPLPNLFHQLLQK
jgi:hypothetical protein